MLSWLHKFELGVKVKHYPDHDFHYIVTTEGDKTINIKRHLLQNPDYIKVLGIVTLTDSQKQFVETMTEDQRVDAVVAIQQELLRARMGYNTVDVLANGFIVFQNVPIRANMNEKDVLDAVWNIEAMISLIFTNNALVERNIRAQRGELSIEPIPRRSGGTTDI